MRNRIYKYFLLSFLIVAGGIVYFTMLRSNQIVIKSVSQSQGEAENGVVSKEFDKRENMDSQPNQLNSQGVKPANEGDQKQDVRPGSGQPENRDATALSEKDSVTEPQGKDAAKETGIEDNGEGKKVNINTAGKAELMTLKGIGEKKAELIIRDRQERGAFRRIEDIMRIKGIKSKAFQKIKDQIVVSD